MKMKKFRRTIMGNKNQSQGPRPEAVSVHVETTSTVLDDLRGQATWEEEWMENNPSMATVSDHERKVHMLSDLLSKADGVVAFREVIGASPALRALIASESGGAARINPVVSEEEAKYRLIQEKLVGEGQKFSGDAANGTGDAGGGVDAGTAVILRSTRSTRDLYDHRDRLRSFLERKGNTSCADCTAKLPTWASVSAGVFLCTQCAGCHRSLGVHISKILSVQLDDWTEEQVEFMSEMGNALANSFLEYHVPSSWLKPSHLEPREYREAYIKAKYQDRLFEFRGHKKPVIKPPPAMIETSVMMAKGEMGGNGLGEHRVAALSQGMTEYIGFVNIVLVRGRNLVSPGFGQLQYMAVLRIGGQEVRSRWARSDGAPSWAEKLMLCWDGSMPLNIDVYGGKEHIGQAQISLHDLLASPKGGRRRSSPRRGRRHGSTPRACRNIDEQLARDGGGRPPLDNTHYYLSSDGESGPPTPATPAGLSRLTPRGRPSPLRRPAESALGDSGTPADSTQKTEGSPSDFSTPEGRGRGAAGGARQHSSLPTLNGGIDGLSISIGDSLTSTFDSPGADDDDRGRGSPARFAFVSGESFKAGGSTVGSVGEGEDPSTPDTRGSSSKQGYTRPPTPSAIRAASLLGGVSCVKNPMDSSCTPVKKLPGGELYVNLQDKKEGPGAAGERYTGFSPGTASGSLGSSRGTSPRTLSGLLGNGGHAAMSISSSTKSLNNMILKLGKSREPSKDNSGTSGHSQSRPAQGGVVLKLDFVRIEH